MAVCLVVLVAVTAVWVIRSEGEKNRQVLREESGKLKQEIRDTSGSSVKDAAKEAAGLPGQILDEVRGVIISDDSSEDPAAEGNRSSDDKAASKPRRRDGGKLVSDIFKLGRDLAEATDRVGQQVLALSV